MQIYSIKRALLSVSDKTGVVALARALIAKNIEIISTGGTGKTLAQAGITYTPIETLTGMNEMLDGRVKTLHPCIHGGILGRRDAHADEALQHQLSWIDLVVVNFYPFSQVLAQQKDMDESELIEHIDIGGPTLVRAAAKNFTWVTVVVDPNDYSMVTQSIDQTGGVSFDQRRRLAAKVFALTAQYDAVIAQYFVQQEGGCMNAHTLTLPLKRHASLRYGENPHQAAAAFSLIGASGGILSAQSIQGKALSYNNIQDADAAWSCIREFDEAACVIVKHATPCGVAKAETAVQAFTRALACDAQSAFGGIVALNRRCDEACAQVIANIFMEVIIAPDYSPEALTIFKAKPNLRVLALSEQAHTPWEVRWVNDGLLMQEKDQHVIESVDLKWVTQKNIDAKQVDDLLFAWKALKHIKSNGILLAKAGQTIGIGAGQVSRVDAVDLALHKAGDKVKGAVLVSDAFFPFRDSIDRLAQSGIVAILQPGGSVRDDEVIAACDEYGIAMAFTGVRCFKH